MNHQNRKMMMVNVSMGKFKFKLGRTSNRKIYYDDLLRSQTKPHFYYPLYTRLHASGNKWQTNLTFKLQDRFSFGDSLTDIKQFLGEPDQEVENEKHGAHVLMYRRLIGEFKAHCRLHFIDGKLFYFSLRFRYLSEAEQELVKNGLEFKYLHGALVVSKQEMIVADNQGNHMIMDKGVDLVLHYLSGDDVLQHLMEFEMDLRVAKKSAYESNKVAELLKAV